MVEKAVKKAEAKAEPKMNPGDAYLCEVCGLQVNVDICGEFLASKAPLSCCGQKMKARKAAKK